MQMQICTYQHSGLFISPPRSVNCTARALDLGRRIVYPLALSTFLSFANSPHMGIPPLESTSGQRHLLYTYCSSHPLSQRLQREEWPGPHILQRSDHKWTTAYPVQYSNGFFGKVANQPLTRSRNMGKQFFRRQQPSCWVIRTAGSLLLQNHCFTPPGKNRLGLCWISTPLPLQLQWHISGAGISWQSIHP